MVNFLPLKKYMFYCLDEFIIRYDLQPPFLDVGCGGGDLSRYLASKGWPGKAIDFSYVAIENAKCNLKSFTQVEIKKMSLFEENEKFKTIFLWDVIEHIQNDSIALEKVCSLLLPNGHVLVSIPSNPNEWRWDDDFYGHSRRYTVEEITAKLVKSGLKPIVFWDFTYPFFWFFRRIHIKFNKQIVDIPRSKENKTKVSSAVNAWDIPIISYLFNKFSTLWRPLFKLQFICFRNSLRNGHEMFVLAKKL